MCRKKKGRKDKKGRKEEGKERGNIGKEERRKEGKKGRKKERKQEENRERIEMKKEIRKEKVIGNGPKCQLAEQVDAVKIATSKGQKVSLGFFSLFCLSFLP